MEFLNEKRLVLQRIDRSSKGSWDKPVIELCNLLNETENYYTTSSCSGRIVLLKTFSEKQKDVVLYAWHELVSLEDFKRKLEEIDYNDIFFKFEPCILHVMGKDLERAEKLVKAAWNAGFRKSGIVDVRRGMCQLVSTENIGFRLVSAGKILVNDAFLDISLKDACEKMKKNWDKIEKLINIIRDDL